VEQQENEQTLVLIKPDALKNSLTGYVLSQLSEFHTGLRFAATKIVHVSTMLAGEHYAEHRGKFFFPSLLDYIQGRLHYPKEPYKRRVIALVYQGPRAVAKVRELCGPTNPHVARDKQPGCIRSLGTVEMLKDAEGKPLGERMDNLIHASANPADAEREIKLWFKPGDIPPAMHPYPTDVSKSHYYYKDGKLFVGIFVNDTHKNAINLDYDPKRWWVSSQGVRTVLDEAIAYVRALPVEKAFITGGATIYRLAMKVADRLELTRIHHDYAGDVRFPDFDPAEWEIETTETHEELDSIANQTVQFTYESYRRRRHAAKMT